MTVILGGVGIGNGFRSSRILSLAAAAACSFLSSKMFLRANISFFTTSPGTPRGLCSGCWSNHFALFFSLSVQVNARAVKGVKFMLIIAFSYHWVCSSFPLYLFLIHVG
jgi:hypothetical protein